MAVWTISAEEGTGAGRIAAVLAEASGAALLDGRVLAHAAHEMTPELDDFDDIAELEERVGGRLNLLALSMAIMAGSADAVRTVQLHRRLPEIGRIVVGAIARQPCVIVAPGAFAVLPDHHTAVHVRLRAPFAWRAATYQREHLVDLRRAEKTLKHDDRVKRSWVHSVFGADLGDPRPFSLVLDVSRLREDRIVDVLLAAAAVPAAALAR